MNNNLKAPNNNPWKEGAYDERGEYWSWDALREQNINELYPPTKTESTEEHEVKLELIEELRKADTAFNEENFSPAISSSPTNNIAQEKSEFKKSIRHQFKDDKYDFTIAGIPYDENNPNQFKDQILNGWSRIIQKRKPSLRSFFMIRKNRAEIQNDIDWVERKKEQINSNPQQSQESLSGKQFEAIFYPLVSMGLFMDEETDTFAKPIYASEYDDLHNGVDCAIKIPLKTENGETIYQDIAFDLTTAISARTIGDKLEKEFKEPGMTTIKYAKDSDMSIRAEITPDTPHFMIGLSAENIHKVITPIHEEPSDDTTESTVPIKDHDKTTHLISIDDKIKLIIYTQIEQESERWQKCNAADSLIEIQDYFDKQIKIILKRHPDWNLEIIPKSDDSASGVITVFHTNLQKFIDRYFQNRKKKDPPKGALL